MTECKRSLKQIDKALAEMISFLIDIDKKVDHIIEQNREKRISFDNLKIINGDDDE